MKDIVIFLLCLLIAFPCGAGFERFVRWLRPKLKTPASFASGSVYLATVGVVFNLAMAVIRGFRHDTAGLQTHLVVAAIFTSVTLGAWGEARRFPLAR